MNKQFYLTPIDENLTVITTPGQSGPENNGHEGVLYTHKALGLEPHH